MTDKTKRDFFKLSLASGCLAAFSGAALAQSAKKEDLSCEERIQSNSNKIRRNSLKERMRILIRLKSELGDDVTKIVRQYNIDRTEKRIAKRDIKDRSLNGVKTELFGKLNPDQFEFKAVVDTDEKLEYRVTKCVVADILKDYNEPELAHALTCAGDIGWAKGLNPDIKFSRTKTLVEGDCCCNHCYELKKKA